MIETWLQGALKLAPSEHLEPYQRAAGLEGGRSEERGMGTTRTYRLVSDEGETTAVIDGWCVDGACYGYVRFDASGEVVTGREVFSLTRGHEHQPLRPRY